MIHKSSAFIGLPGIIKISTCYHIAKAIAIYIPGAGYTLTQFSIGLVAFNPGRKCGIDTRGGTMINKGSTFAELAIVVTMSSYYYIAVAIAVYITGAGYRNAHICIGIVTFHHGG